ncbi:MAG: hypothetical protein ACP5HS_06685 [Anaerolineae bacterium]
MPEPIAVTLAVVEVLEQLGVNYLVGGSLASTVYGHVRTTLDSDLIADLRPEHVPPLIEALQPAFYVDEAMIREALAGRGSFNLIHLDTMFKVDIFVVKQRAFDREEMRRRVRHVVVAEPERAIYVATAEDTILAKLEWYHRGECVSERQWRDVIGVIKVQGERLDTTYLRHWAASLGIAELLEQALAEAGTDQLV